MDLEDRKEPRDLLELKELPELPEHQEQWDFMEREVWQISSIFFFYQAAQNDRIIA